MKYRIITGLAAAAMIMGFAASAEAYPYHHGGGYYHGGGGVSVGFYSGPAYYPAYYPSYPAYYYPPAYPVAYPAPYPYDAPPPAGYAQPPQGAQVPMPTADNSYCREYHSNVLINGVYQPTYGTACRQQDGTWKLVN